MTSPPAEKVTPGFLGFIVVFVMAIIVVLLVRSMVGHLRKVRYSPDPAATAPNGGTAKTEADGDQAKD